MPQFGGFCANGINYAVPRGEGGGPDTWRINRGKLYVFGAPPLERRGGGTIALFTGLKRLVFRVPHYETDKALHEEFNARLAARTLPVMPGAAQVVPR